MSKESPYEGLADRMRGQGYEESAREIELYNIAFKHIGVGSGALKSSAVVRDAFLRYKKEECSMGHVIMTIMQEMGKHIEDDHES